MSTVYKVRFTGYHLVEADSEEEAIEKSQNGDWLEEYLEPEDTPEELGEVEP